MQKVLTDGQGKVLCFVICYFGILPDTLPITLKTIAENPGYNWLLFTDDTRRFKYPQNVRVCYSSFQKLRERIQKCFDFPIALETPKNCVILNQLMDIFLKKNFMNMNFGDIVIWINILVALRNIFLTHFFVSMIRFFL